MPLRRQLLLVALCTLVLPLTGWLYVRQMESLLRQGQAQALIASARALARGLAASGDALPARGHGWYVQSSTQSITVDGYGDDWAPLTPWMQGFPGHGQLLLAHDAQGMYLFARVADATRTRADSGDADAMRADHVILELGQGDHRQAYLIASAAPGTFEARALGLADPQFPPALRGAWQEDGSGYSIELHFPAQLQPDALGIRAYDAGQAQPPRTAVDMHPLLRDSPALSADLAQLAPPGTRTRVLAPGAWRLAQSGNLTLPGGHQGPGWLAAAIYRLLIAAPLQPAVPWTDDAPRISTPEIMHALRGKPDAVWRASATGNGVVLGVAVPLREHGQVRGALSLEKASQSVPLLANRALLTLLLASLAVLLVAGGVLFAFATRLSLRLRRLRDAAEQAQANEGRYAGRFPLTDAADEVGDLSRSFARLFDAVGNYTDYLRTLASKLSHELNTPLAIVKSSLDNLEHALGGELNMPDEARPYLQRARDGAARLGALVRAMSAATRMERAIAAAEAEDVDLCAVVRGCIEAYRPLLGERTLETDLPQAPLPLHGAPELIAQALDKLVDNALSFAPPTGWIRIALHTTDSGAALTVANQGPLLPDAMQGRLFDSLVSLRETSAHGATPHLGLGLYVVRLIAERHGGEAVARNLDGADGVAFTLHLRGMPRQRMVDAKPA